MRVIAPAPPSCWHALLALQRRDPLHHIAMDDMPCVVVSRCGWPVCWLATCAGVAVPRQQFVFHARLCLLRVPCGYPPCRLLLSLQRYYYDTEQLCLVWSEVESLLLESNPGGRHAAFQVMNAIAEFHPEACAALRWEFVNALRGHQNDYKWMQQSLCVLINDGATIDPLGPAVIPVLLKWMQESGACACTVPLSSRVLAAVCAAPC